MKTASDKSINTTSDKPMKTTSGFTEDINKEMNVADPQPVESKFSNLSQCYVSISGHTRIFTATRYGKRYMLKCLKNDFLYTPIYRQALTKEFEIGLQLEHPNICHTIGMEEVENLGTTIVMEYIDGDTLQYLIDQQLLTAEMAHKIAHELMDALEYMHNKQMIHRDLKPANIMVTHNGKNVKLIDFGLSDSDSFTILKLPAGTSGYIAPEQLLQGAKSDPQADIYSLGMVLLDMAKATHDRHLRKTAEVCISRDLSIRPKSIREVREHKHESPLLKAGGIVLGIIALLLISLIAFTYYHRAQSKEKQNVPTENGKNDSPDDNANEIQDYQLWQR